MGLALQSSTPALKRGAKPADHAACGGPRGSGKIARTFSKSLEASRTRHHPYFVADVRAGAGPATAWTLPLGTVDGGAGRGAADGAGRRVAARRGRARPALPGRAGGDHRGAHGD